MKGRVIITGGAGFIGSRLAQTLLQRGYEVSILDSFTPQIHGERGDLPSGLRDSVQLFHGDVRDEHLCERALQGQDVLVHLAAETGTGQSMYLVRHYSDVNLGGTAVLMELLLKRNYPVRSIVVASSRAVYGEGAGRCEEHGKVFPHQRRRADMEKADFEPKCPICGRDTAFMPTPEDAPLRPSSVYGLTKQAQEQMVLMYADALGLNGFALRYQNVYGPGQSLRNPYTGILAIFSNQARANEPIYVFEDGKESRDFVFVDDAVEATVRCIEAPAQPPTSLNVGLGRSTRVLDVVKRITDYFSSKSEVAITGAFREGDIRHNCADNTKLCSVLGWIPERSFEEGMRSFLNWASGEALTPGAYEESLAEMRTKGLIRG